MSDSLSPAASDDTAHLADLAASLDCPLPPVRRVTFRSGEHTVSALQWGTDAPRLVLLHGAGLNAHTWDSTILSAGLPALAIDLPGHGDSSWYSDGTYAPSRLAETLLTVMREGVSHPVVLVGQSLGGLTAAALAAQAPELVRAVVVVDITPGIDASAGPNMLREFYRRVEFTSRDEVVDYAMSFGLGGTREQALRGVTLNTRVRPDGVVEWKHHLARLIGASAPGTRLSGTSPEQGWRDLEAIAAELTLVRGTTGFLSDEATAEFARRLPRAHVVELEAGHNVQETAFAPLANLLRDAATPIPLDPAAPAAP